MAMLVITRWYRKGPADSWMSRWQSFAKAQQGSSTPPPALAILAELAPEQLGIAGSAWNKSSTITVVCGSQPSMACPLCTGYTQIPWFSNMLKAKTSSSHIFTIKWQLWGILYPIRRNHIVTARGPSQGWPPLLPVLGKSSLESLMFGVSRHEQQPFRIVFWLNQSIHVIFCWWSSQFWW